MDYINVEALAVPEGDVLQIIRDDKIIWQTSMNLIPEEYQQVEYLEASNGVNAYIDLGLTFDTAAKVRMGMYVVNTNSCQIFGAAENNGLYRCMMSTGYKDKIFMYGYGNNGNTYISVANDLVEGGWNNLEYILQPQLLSLTNETTGIIKKGMTNVGYTMTSNLYLFGQNYNGTPRYAGYRRISYFQLYDKNKQLVCFLVPCYRKSDGVTGMYDVIRKLFLINAGTGKFQIGAKVPYVAPTYKNWITYSTETDGITIYNDDLGYKDGYRVRSGGAEAEDSKATCTGYIPVKGADIIRLSGYDALAATGSQNGINVYNSAFECLGQASASNPTGYGILGWEAYRDYNWGSIVENPVDIYKWTVPPDNDIAYMRVTAYTNGGSGKNVIITINEEID